MPEPSERAKRLAESATDGEGLGPEVIERIARGMDKAREEGRQEGRAGIGWPAAMDQPISESNVDGVGRSLAEWQDAIRNHVVGCSGAPDELIDDSGADSGDPLDLTLAEIDQGFDFMDDRIAELESKLARWRPVMKAALLADRDITDGLEPLRSSVSQALDALSEQERSELLEEAENG